MYTKEVFDTHPGLLLFHVKSYDLSNDVISIDKLMKRKSNTSGFTTSRMQTRFEDVDLSEFGGVVSISPRSGIGSFVSEEPDWFETSLGLYPTFDYDSMADFMVSAVLSNGVGGLENECDRWYGVYRHDWGARVDSLIVGDSLWDLLYPALESYARSNNMSTRKSDIDSFVGKIRSHFDASHRYGVNLFSDIGGVYILPSHDALRSHLDGLSLES